MSRQMDNSGKTREEQRSIGHLVLSTNNALRVGKSTGIATIHASADLMEWVSLEGGSVFRDYTAEQRRRMASEGRALPDGSFPIGTCEDAENAIHAQGRAKDKGEVVAHIRKRVRALGCSGDIFDPYK